jgi:predicted transcriptional regulator
VLQKRYFMRRSKLEIALDILKILAQKGPMKLTHMMFKANVNCDVLKKNVELLLKQGLIEERSVGRERMVYAITHQGLTLTKGWKELKLLLPKIECESDLQPFFRNSVSVRTEV